MNGPLGKCFYDDCYIQICRNCGNIVISTCCSNRCCICDNGNLKIIPFKDHPKLSIEWLNSHGFRYIKERMGVDCVVK